MTKEIAMQIFMLNLEDNNIQQKKWDLKKKLDLASWDQASIEAMKFMMEEKS
jgi:hypothetical protein